MLFQFFFKYTIHLSIVLVVGLLPYSIFADDLVETNPIPIGEEETFKSVVPSLMGLTVPEVLQLLPQYDLSLGVVTEIIDANPDNANKVIQQSVAENAEVNRLSSIDISVAIANSVTPNTKLSEKEVKTSRDTTTKNNDTETRSEKITESVDKTKDLLANIPVDVNVIEKKKKTSSDTVKENNNTETILEKAANTPVDELPIEIPLNSHQVQVEVTKSTEPPPKIDPVDKSTEKTDEGDVATEEKPTLIETVATETEVNSTEKKTAIIVDNSDSTNTKVDTVDNESTTKNTKEVVTETRTTASTPTTTNQSTHQYSGHKVSVSISPSEVQVSREITMEMHIDPPIESDKLVYQFNLSGKLHTRKSPVFTHVFDEEDKVIITGSARILGNPWIHSASQRINVGKYVAKKIKVPNIVGLSEKEAAALLTSKGLLVGNIQEKIIKGGQGVIKQMPAAGSIRSEDDNKIHYVKAIDEKFKISVTPPRGELDTETATTIAAQITPKATKVRYRFLVNGKPYFSTSPQWQHTFTKVGNNTVVVEAMVAGEGTFVSPAIHFAVAEAWHLPKAVISPFTVTLEKGKNVTFKSTSSYDRRGGLDLTWQNTQGKSLKQAALLVNTQDLKEGEHIIKLRIKDEKGNEDTATAQLIVTAAKTDKSEPKHEDDKNAVADKSDKAEPENNENNAEVDKPASSDTANSDVKAVEETNKLMEKEVDAALASLDDEKSTDSSAQPEIDNVTETQQTAQQAVDTANTLAQQQAAQQKAAEEAKRLALMNDAAQLEQRLNSEPAEEVLEVTIPEKSPEAVIPSLPIQDVTVKSQRIVAESSNSTAQLTVNIAIWLLSILIIVVTIFWILRKSLKTSSSKEPSEIEVKADIPESPYKSAEQGAKRHSANRKTKVDPHLVDFDLGKQSQQPSTKKNDLTDFKLDD